MNEDKKKYEVSFIVGREDGEETILKILARHNTLLLTRPEVGRIKLSHPLKKVGVGRFGYLIFEVNPASLKEIEGELKTNPGILRFLIFKAPTITARSEPRERIRTAPTQMERQRAESEGPDREAEFIARQVSGETPRRPEEKRGFNGELSNEALEKKLEEILK